MHANADLALILKSIENISLRTRVGIWCIDPTSLAVLFSRSPGAEEALRVAGQHGCALKEQMG